MDSRAYTSPLAVCSALSEPGGSMQGVSNRDEWADLVRDHTLSNESLSEAGHADGDSTGAGAGASAEGGKPHAGSQSHRGPSPAPAPAHAHAHAARKGQGQARATTPMSPSCGPGAVPGGMPYRGPPPLLGWGQTQAVAPLVPVRRSVGLQAEAPMLRRLALTMTQMAHDRLQRFTVHHNVNSACTYDDLVGILRSGGDEDCSILARSTNGSVLFMSGGFKTLLGYNGYSDVLDATIGPSPSSELTRLTEGV
jgi:hypothetical protein